MCFDLIKKNSRYLFWKNPWLYISTITHFYWSDSQPNRIGTYLLIMIWESSKSFVFGSVALHFFLVYFFFRFWLANRSIHLACCFLSRLARLLILLAGLLTLLTRELIYITFFLSFLICFLTFLSSFLSLFARLFACLTRLLAGLTCLLTSLACLTRLFTRLTGFLSHLTRFLPSLAWFLALLAYLLTLLTSLLTFLAGFLSLLTYILSLFLSHLTRFLTFLTLFLSHLVSFWILFSNFLNQLFFRRWTFYHHFRFVLSLSFEEKIINSLVFRIYTFFDSRPQSLRLLLPRQNLLGLSSTCLIPHNITYLSIFLLFLSHAMRSGIIHWTLALKHSFASYLMR